ncbi:MAG: polysaccharide pyruvyl transferase family protein [Hyphomonadaceae bacterium]|nr:polysaccharide pyruvyl transferase family protein [Hyphomonadaceae bacterium]
MTVSQRIHAGGDRRPHVLLYGLFGIGNTGNDASLEVALKHLRSALPSAQVTLASDAPETAAKRFGVPAVPIRPRGPALKGVPQSVRRVLDEAWRWRAVDAALRDVDHFLVPGTGMLDDFGSPDAEHARRLSMWTQCAARREIPISFVSIGAGPVVGARSRRLFALAAARATHRSYRDTESREFVRDVLHIDVSRDAVTPDLAFALDFDTAPVSGPLQTVGLGVMKYHSWNSPAGAPDDIYAAYFNKLADVGVGLIGKGLKLVLLTGEPADEPAALAMRERLLSRCPGGQVDIASIATLRDIVDALRGCEAVVATRFHNVAAALMSGRPVVSIGYSIKNTELMASFGLKDYCEDVNAFSPETVLAKFDSATADFASESARILDRAAALRSAVSTHLNEIMAAIRVKDTV